MYAALTIAGSDSGGGAGIQADLKTFEAHGVFGTSVLTALTAQNTQGVERVEAVSNEMVGAQLQAVLSDFSIGAAKTGMLFSAELIEVVANGLVGADFPLVVDPVMVSTSGHTLLQDTAIEAMKHQILPLAAIITPNIPEAELLTGTKITSQADMIRCGEALSERYPEASILIKGFHLPDGNADEISDVLVGAGETHWFTLSRIDTPNTHGTGCTLSAAIAANLALGKPLVKAVEAAKSFTHAAIRHSWANLGKGRGTLRHNHRLIETHEA